MSYEVWRLSFQSSEQAAKSAYESHQSILRENKLLKGEVSEWYCEKCNTIHPHNNTKSIFQECPACHMVMIPTSRNIRLINELEKKLDIALGDVKIRDEYVEELRGREREALAKAEQNKLNSKTDPGKIIEELLKNLDKINSQLTEERTKLKEVAGELSYKVVERLNKKTKKCNRLEKKLEIAISALNVLSKLGNGDRVGTSEGNTIACAAIARINDMDCGPSLEDPLESENTALKQKVETLSAELRMWREGKVI